MKNVKIKLFREDDYKSRLLNVDKYEWIKDLLEKRYGKGLTQTQTQHLLAGFRDIVDNFNNSNLCIHNINEADTVNYFIVPFLSMLLPGTYSTSEFKLIEQNIRLDSVLYDSRCYENGECTYDDANFIILEYKKANIYSKIHSNNVYDIAKEHGLLQKQSAKSSTDKYVLKGSQSRQMVQYLDATKSLGSKITMGSNTSAGIITNGLSYYFMVCNGNDKNASNQTWSILYKLDIAELADNMDVKEARTAISTFINLINTFLSNKARTDFFRWYDGQYTAIKNSINISGIDMTDYTDYVTKILKNRKSCSSILTTYNNYKKYIGV